MKMNNKFSDISSLCIFVIFCIFTIATTSIGIECYDRNKEYKDIKAGNIVIIPKPLNAKLDNYSFLVFNLICAIFVMLSLFFFIYGRAKMPY